METTLVTKNDDYDGVLANPAPKDNYNLSSDNLDILRLEICKSQFSKEQITECLTQQQLLIKNSDPSVSSTSMFLIIAFVVSMILGSISFCIFRNK